MVTTESLGSYMSEAKNEKIFSSSQQIEALEKLKELIPGVVSDGELNVKAITDFTGVPAASPADASIAFGIVWPGKDDALQALSPTAATLAPDVEHSLSFDSAENVFIEGDNLEVLKIIEHAYDDKVRLIYIDPPYNTGNDFVYNDDFSDDKKRYLQITGQMDAEGNKLKSNPDTSGRKHANWLSMMYPRLIKAKNLLTQDGSIFVSIDDNEVHHLRMLMDHVFGPENFLGQFVWAAGRKNDAKFVSNSHEYMICYARNIANLKDTVGKWRTRKEGLDAIYNKASQLGRIHGNDYKASSRALKAWFSSLPDGEASKRSKQYCWIDSRGVYFADNISWPGGGGPKYEVKHPITGLPVKVPSGGWRYSQVRMAEQIQNDLIHFGDDEKSVPCMKRYLVDSEFEVPYSVFYKDGRGATMRLRDFLGGEYFDYPKDETVIQSIVEFATDKDSLVMDFFGGSGTTGHAVALQNQKDGGRRRYVFVTLDEATAENSVAQKAGIKSVSDIALMRLRKVATEFDTAKEQGLKVFRLSKSAFKPYFAEDGIAYDNVDRTLDADATDHQIVTQIGLLNGVCLDEKWEWLSIAEANAVLIAGNLIVLAREMSEDILSSLKKLEFKNAFFIEDSFAGKDALKKMVIYDLTQLNRGFEAY
jgi:adenine-specific DNA-methyltransferase